MWTFLIKNYRLAYLIIFLVIILGTISMIQIPRESSPEVDIPVVIVQTIFPGANGMDVEELVTNILEDRLLSLNNVKKVSSTSAEGYSNISVEFNANYKGNLKEDVQGKVDEAKSVLPEDAKDPIVLKLDISSQAIMIFSLSGPYDVTQINEFAKELKERIEKISDISEVRITGGQEREIQVLVNKALIDNYGLSISQVTRAIQTANVDIPTGSIETSGANYNIRLAGRVFSAEEIKKIPVASFNEAVVLVEDLAEVVDGYHEKSTISSLSVNGRESQSAVTIQILKSKGGNIVKLSDNIKEVIAESESNFLPDNIEIETLVDMSTYVKDDLGQLFKGGIQTILIILPLLCLFVGGREALLASFAIPFSFLITFIFLSVFGMTLNFLSLFSLILALGILIDTAIVIVERMNNLIKDHNMNSKEAAVSTVLEFKWPLVVGTLTTVFAFLPMLLMSGIMGQYIKHIPITVSIVLLSSLFVGLGITPVLGLRFLKKNHKVYLHAKLLESIRKVTDRFLNNFIEKYKNLLSILLNNKKIQKRFFLIIIGLFIFSSLLPATGILKLNMFPSEDTDFFEITIEVPIGTPLEETANQLKVAENILRQEKQIKSFTVNIGSGGENKGNIFINLKDKKERTQESPEIVTFYQEVLSREMPNLKVSATQTSSGPPSFAPVDISIKGSDLGEIEKIANEFKKILKEISGTNNVQITNEESKKEFVISIDREKAEIYGTSTIELAQILRNVVQGSEATVIRKDGEEIKVLVKYDLENVSISSLESITIATRKGNIPLSEFTQTELSAGRSSIVHEDGLRVVRATSFVDPGTVPIEVINSLKERIKEINIPEGIEIVYGGEQADINQSFNDLFKSMFLAVFLIGTILILQFHSYRQPFFILITIPLALIGVFPGLVLLGKALSFPAFVGIVALAGIVVNNGIILIDKINNNRRADLPELEAIINACQSRFRPVFLTTITTMIGILPISLTSDLWAGLGFTIIFGLGVSATLTLFMVPLLYYRFAEKELDK